MNLGFAGHAAARVGAPAAGPARGADAAVRVWSAESRDTEANHMTGTESAPPSTTAPPRASSANALEIAVVGVGPRGLSVLERLCANAGADFAHLRVRVRLVDPHLGRGGRVWRTDQSPHLLMNTIASQVTLFADETVDCAGPVVPGPDLHEWAGFAALAGEFDDLPEAVRAEARALGPDDYPTRAFYGHYLDWVLRHLLRTAPPNVAIELHQRVAVDLDEDPDGVQHLTLAGGERITGLDAVVLTTGHADLRPTGEERAHAEFARAHGLRYLPPDNPAETDHGAVEPGEKVLIRGLGLNFFDHMALLTAGRGGRFERRADGTLAYHASGREPLLVAGARRGVPHHARGENQKGPRGRHVPLFLTEERIAALAGAGRPLRFLDDVWPWIDGEVRAVYYAALLAERDGPGAVAGFLAEYRPLVETVGALSHLAAESLDLVTARPGAGTNPSGATANPLGAAANPLGPPANPLGPPAYPLGPPAIPVTLAEAEGELLDAWSVPRADRWDWAALAAPHRGRDFAHPGQFRDWLLGHLRADVREARLGNVRGPLKAALDVLRDLRNEVRLVVDHGSLSGDSHEAELQRWYTPLNAYLSIGPPVGRIEEMIALLEAGVLEVVGPGVTVERDERRGEWVMGSPAVPGSRHRAGVLLEARLPESDVRRTLDPLVESLLRKGCGVPYRIPVDGGGHLETGGLAVTRRPYRLVERSGAVHPRRFAFGIPTESVHWATAAGVRPGVNSVILGDADAVARASVLAADARAADAVGRKGNRVR
ncbi:FAD/NAD(P)-binding protein [Actinosynnema pretiosum subsp. pretiosum]|uniref:FAD/NAD(P)-binding protein n=1 Tax=Actinosynnema pretiosum subsp. pretiosum TaxID=103721 RepID=A0AA45L629_9PSEU|nr:FAD/NAD(P)-binding protein [Actinosynnema pretiosum subsp. pretiosum]